MPVYQRQSTIDAEDHRTVTAPYGFGAFTWNAQILWVRAGGWGNLVKCMQQEDKEGEQERAAGSHSLCGAAQEEWSNGVQGQDGTGCGAGSGQPPLMDPVTDLKLNRVDIVDAVRERQALLQVRSRASVWSSPFE